MSLLEKSIHSVQSPSQEWRQKATAHLDQLLMPHWALGKVMDYAVDIATIQETLKPSIKRRASLLFGADHGVVESGVSPCSPDLTHFMMRQFPKGGPAISVLAEHIGADLIVTDVGTKGDFSDMIESGQIIDKKVAEGTKDFSKEPAMSREQAIASLEAGIEVVESVIDKYDLFVLGEMGIGNTTPSSAIVSLFTGMSVNEVTGCGAGLDEDGRQKKAAVIEAALKLHAPDKSDAIGVLSTVGGFEIGAMAGAMIAAAAHKKVIVLDGFICTAAALIAQALVPESVEYMLLGHRSMEPGHIAAAELLGKEPILNLNFRLGEGSGAAIAVPVLDSSMAIIHKMATFADLGITLG